MLFNPRRGSRRWLTQTELKYGGRVNNVPRNRVSPYDPRSSEEILVGGMVGGDRMSTRDHGYGKTYAKFLRPFVKTTRRIVLAEVGILRGNGLAIWCDLFPGARIIGLDIDLDHVKGNLPRLTELGAFRRNIPELYEFDQFIDQAELLASILKGDKIDLMVDDGFHSIQSIITSFNSFLPHLSENFVAFIEDNKDAAPALRDSFPQFKVEAFGEMSVVTSKPV